MNDITPTEPVPTFDYQQQLNDVFRNAPNATSRIAVVLKALREYAVDGSCDLLCGVSIPGGLQLTFEDLAIMYGEYCQLEQAAFRPDPAPAIGTGIHAPADTAWTAGQAYLKLLAARTALADAERAHFQATTGGRP